MVRSTDDGARHLVRGVIAAAVVAGGGIAAIAAWNPGGTATVRAGGAGGASPTRSGTSSAADPQPLPTPPPIPQPMPSRTGPPPVDRPSPEDINVRGPLSDRVDVILRRSPGLDALFASGDATVIRRSENTIDGRNEPIGEWVIIRFTHRVDLPESSYRRFIPLNEATVADPASMDATGRFRTIPVPPGQLHGVLVVDADVDLELGRVFALTPGDERMH